MELESEVAGAPQPAAPRLVIDARAATPDGVGPAHRMLGLSLLERTALAARRSGFGALYVLADAADADRYRALLVRVEDVEVGEAPAAADGGRAPTVYVPGLVVGERGWLEAATGAAVPADGCVTLGAGVVVCGHGVPWPRVCAIGAEAGPASNAPRQPPLRIGGKADLATAERRLMRALGKSTDGFMERHIERPVSRILSRRLAATPITPNQMTLISAAVGLCAAPFFLSATPLWQTIGALIFLAHSILDSCDGELARLRFQESRWGGILDFWGDNVVHAAIFGCMALGWSRAVGADWPLALGAAAVLGALGSASFVYFRVMRPKRGEGPLYVSVAKEKKSRLVSMLDSLSRRDFIYLVLALSLFGKAAWFLTLAAIGAPIFFAMLLFVAAQEARAQRTARA
jgi:1L-myo-inositol 1-phosphate cytidylyltransferase / CDP-L-myo-inositol myo-inositolphosphotransferase